MASGPFTLAQLAKAVGMSIDQVKIYRDGLLQPPRRRPGRSGDTAFYADHVERLRFIQRALAYGFCRDDVAQLVGETELTTCNDIYRLSVHRLEELRRVAGPNDATVQALEDLVATWRRDGRSKRLPKRGSS